MKTPLFFKVRNVLSMTAIMALMSTATFAQDYQSEDQIKNYEAQSTFKLQVEPVIEVSKLKAKSDLALTNKEEIEKALQDQATLANKDIKMLDTKIVDTEKKQAAPNSELTLEERKELENATEIEASQLQAKKEEKEEAIAEEKEQSSSDSKYDYTIATLLCMQQNQIDSMNTNFANFQQTISQSLLSMQTMTQQLMLMNQNQTYRAPSVFDRYESMYPIMMMQQMQHSIYTQSLLNNYMPKNSMYDYNQATGQLPDAQYNMGPGLHSPLNFAYDFNQGRTVDMLNMQQSMSDSKNVFSLMNQNPLINNTAQQPIITETQAPILPTQETTVSDEAVEEAAAESTGV